MTALSDEEADGTVEEVEDEEYSMEQERAVSNCTGDHHKKDLSPKWLKAVKEAIPSVCNDHCQGGKRKSGGRSTRMQSI